MPDVRGAASRGCGLTLPLAAWLDVANENRDGDPVHVTVRATKDGSCVASSTTKVDVSFAKEDLAGGIYYWQSATFGGVGGKTGGIYYHDFGTFDPTPTPFYTSGASGTCVGCHTLSRDGVRMALMTDDPDADDEFGDVKMHVLDVATRTVIGGGTISAGPRESWAGSGEPVPRAGRAGRRPSRPPAKRWRSCFVLKEGSIGIGRSPRAWVRKR